MICDNCAKRGQCPVNCEEQNVAMGKASIALLKHCREVSVPEQPMNWIRTWIADNGQA